MNVIREYIREIDAAHHPTPIQRLMFNEEYIRGVLGIDIPLNESYPYSYDLQERILQEQLLLEGFFGDFKKMAGDSKNAALALRYIMQDSSRLQSYIGMLKADLEKAYDGLVEFLEGLLSGIKELPGKAAKQLSKASDWASKILEKVKTFVSGVIGQSGWKGAMLISGALVGIGFIWSKLEGIAPKVLELLSKLQKALQEASVYYGSSLLFEGEEVELKEGSKASKIIKKITSILFSAVKKLGTKALEGLAIDALGSALTGGVSAAFKALKALYGGTKVVFQFLGGPLGEFVSKIKNPEEEAEEAERGEDDPTEGGKKNESHENENLLLRGYIREMITEDFNLGKGTGIEYTALVLDAASHSELASMAPEGWNIYSHHMTIVSPPNQSMRLPSRWLGSEHCVKVVGVAQDEKVMTAKVDLGGLPLPMKGPAIPHVTIATNPKNSGKPVMSNDFSISDYEPISPISICGTVEEVLR